VLTEPASGLGRADENGRALEVPMRGWRDLPAMLRVIRREGPDWVQLEYSNYGWSRWGFAFWLNALFPILRMRGMQVRLALHEFPLRMRQHPMLLPFALIQRLHFWLLCACAQEICTNTRERVATLRRWLPWRTASLRYRPNSNCNPVYTCPPEWRNVLREGRGVQPGDLVVAMYGLFGAGKNMEAAIAAVVQLQKELPLHLWLLGDSSQADPRYLEKLRQAAAPLAARAWWSGNLSPEDVSRHLQAVDIFLLPQPDGHLTRSGSFMAAAAHGLPVIAARNDMNQQEFSSARDFWPITESSANGIAGAIQHLAGNPSLRASLGQNLQSLYEQQFAWGAGLSSPSVADDSLTLSMVKKTTSDAVSAGR